MDDRVLFIEAAKSTVEQMHKAYDDPETYSQSLALLVGSAVLEAVIAAYERLGTASPITAQEIGSMPETKTSMI